MGTPITMTAALTTAYGVMAFVALFAYIPQLLAFWRNPLLCLNTPIITWVMWGVQTVVFHIYALLVNGDHMFIMTTGMFMLATLTCLGIQLYNRWKVKRRVEQADNVVPLAPVTPTPAPSSPTRNVA